MPLEHLKSRAVIAVSGNEAMSLLQRVITANIDNLEPGVVRDCALLTPQGKVLFQFLISRSGNGYLIDCPSDDRDALIKRLTLYKLRSDVQFERSELHAVACADPFDHGLADERADGMGYRAYLASLPSSVVDENAYQARRVGVGLPEIGGDYDSQSIYAHEALLDLTQGIDFKKGCYVGQEVVSRVEHRSTARKRFVRVIASGNLAEKGSNVTANGKTVGVMGSSNGGHGLALVRVDKLSGPTVWVSDMEAELSVPGFASFTLGPVSTHG
ncbi:MAG: folate-binding protein [Pseudomonadota bacterium]